MSVALATEGLVKRFGDRTVLDGIDIELREHEVLALIGGSGSGKSTLLRCLNLLETPDDGRILLDGVEIGGPGTDLDAVRRRVGIVFQQYNLFPNLTVLRNITLAPVHALGLSRADADDRAHALLERFGLHDRADDYPAALSGGQQQRVAIMRALAMEPEILLLDEITAALDPVLVAEVLDTMRELAQAGVTMIVATHEMGFARDVAHRVAFLKDGRIVEVGEPRHLFTSPTHPDTREFLRRVTDAGRL